MYKLRDTANWMEAWVRSVFIRPIRARLITVTIRVAASSAIMAIPRSPRGILPLGRRERRGGAFRLPLLQDRESKGDQHSGDRCIIHPLRVNPAGWQSPRRNYPDLDFPSRNRSPC